MHRSQGNFISEANTSPTIKYEFYCLIPTGLKFSDLSLHQPFLETVWYTDYCVPSQSSWLRRSGVRPENLHIWCLQVTPMMLAQGLDFKTHYSRIFQKHACCKSSRSCPLFLSSPWSLKYLGSGLPPKKQQDEGALIRKDPRITKLAWDAQTSLTKQNMMWAFTEIFICVPTGHPARGEWQKITPQQLSSFLEV